MITLLLSWGVSIFSSGKNQKQTPAFTPSSTALSKLDDSKKFIENAISEVTASKVKELQLESTLSNTDVHPLLHDVYKFMREGIVSSIFFLILMAFSHFIIRRYIRKKDEEKKILIPRLLCTICLSISIAAMLLIPITIISNEIMTTFPSGYYTQWLDRELIFSFWNKIFWGANISLFIILPFTYFLYESEGIRGRPLGKRIKEALLVLLLVAVIFIGFVFIVFSLFYEEKEDSGLFEHFKRISTDYLPFSYSLISTFGNVVVMLSIPSGFSYLITKCINLRIVRSPEDEIKAAKMEITCINIKLEKAAAAGYVNLNKKKSKLRKRLEELRESSINECSGGNSKINNNSVHHQNNNSDSNSQDKSSLNKSDRIMNDQNVNSNNKNDIISSSQNYNINIAKNLNNIINNNNYSINNINSANIIVSQENNSNSYLDNSSFVNSNNINNNGINNQYKNDNSDIQNNNINNSSYHHYGSNINNNNNIFKKDLNFILSQEEIQTLEDSRDELYLYIEKLLKPNNISSRIVRYLSSIFLTIINFGITGWVIFKVFIHLVKRSFELFQLDSIKAYFDVWMSSAIDLSKGSSKLGPFESLLETTIIIYLMISAFVGFLNEPKFSNIKPRIHSTSLRKMIINTGIILLMSSSFPVVVRTLEISRFDLMGYYSHTNYLRNDIFKVIYRCSFLVIVARSYLKSFENSRLVYSFNVNLVLPLLTRFIPSFILNRVLSQSTIQKIKQQQQLEQQILKQQQISAQQTNIVKSIYSVNDSTSSSTLFSIISKNPITSLNNNIKTSSTTPTTTTNNNINNNNNSLTPTTTNITTTNNNSLSSVSLTSSSSSINTTTTTSSFSSSPIMSSISSLSSSVINTAPTSPTLLSKSSSSLSLSSSLSPSNLSAPSSPILNRSNNKSPNNNNSNNNNNNNNNNKTTKITKNQLNISKKNLIFPFFNE